MLLLDEPSLGLAPILVQQIFETIARSADAGVTMLLVEQNALLALQIADHGYVIETGAIVLEGPAAELLANPQVQEALSRVTIRRHKVAHLGGLPYSVLVTDGAHAFMAGVVAQCCRRCGGAWRCRGQRRLVMAAIREGLGSIGLGMDRIVRVDVHLTDLAAMAVIDEAYRGFFADNQLPARTCTQSTQLAGGSRVEITVMARLSEIIEAAVNFQSLNLL